MATSIRLKDIADELDLSITTVSLAMRNSHRVSDETRQLVRNTALRMGYVQRNKSASPIILNRITFISHAERHNSFYDLVLHGAENVCRQFRITPNFLQIEEEDDIDAIVDGSPEHGIILSVGYKISRQKLISIRQMGHPLVLINSNIPYVGIDRILIEDFGGIYNAVCYLYDLGHRSIAYLDGPDLHTSFVDRRNGYRAAIADLGLESIEITNPSLNPIDNEHVMANWLAVNGRHTFTALVAHRDLAAINGMNALLDQGIKVPEEVSVIGFDDLPIAQMVRPTLTTCAVERQLMGELAVKRLFERAEDPDMPSQSISLDTTLIERQSVWPCERRQR